jgi:hypothetical protein
VVPIALCIIIYKALLPFLMQVEEAIQRCGIPGVSWTEQGMIRLGPKKMQDLFKSALDQVATVRIC